MIYYPLSTLMLAGIREILIISTPQRHCRASSALLGDGAQWGIALTYAVQPRPDGLAQAFIIGARLRRRRAVRAGPRRQHLLRPRPDRAAASAADARTSGATVFAYHVQRSRALRRGRVRRRAAAPSRIEEKPTTPKSQLRGHRPLFLRRPTSSTSPRALKPSAARRARDHRPQPRSISSAATLHVERMGRGYAWLDTGTHDSLLEAGRVRRAPSSSARA